MTTTTALVTGANKGLGKETVRRLADLGWTVYLGARQPEHGKQAAAELADGGADVRYLPLDVTSDEMVSAAVATIGSEHDTLDVLVNNAGIAGTRADVSETVPADFLPVYGVNVLGPVRVTHALLPLLRKSAAPQVVMVSSSIASFAVTTDPARPESAVAGLVYPSSKAALNMITTHYAKALDGVRVNAVDPGYTATDLNQNSGWQPVAEGAEAIVAVATQGPDGPTGRFFDRTGEVPW